jgi:hypothetical protein
MEVIGLLQAHATSELVWTAWSKEKSIVPARNRISTIQTTARHYID